ncbi:MAG: hypothetical protein AB7S26_34375 [Sandaracinaceae bacterium]
MNNPYARIGSLLDATRALDPEEMAELHIEQGLPDRAAAIYERLCRESPDNETYRRRLEWLRRLDSVKPIPIRPVSSPPPPPAPSRPPGARAFVESVDHTLRGVPAVRRDASVDESEKRAALADTQPVTGVSLIDTRARRSTAPAGELPLAKAAPTEDASVPRRRIVQVG